jgi:CheY-like chemotaxis protein
MAARVLIVDEDRQYREWLSHHVQTVWPNATLELIDLDDFKRRRIALTRRDCDLVLLSVTFGAGPDDPKSLGLEWLRKLRDQPGFPVVIAIASEGNELTAVRALRLGAADYLPKRLLTPERLSTALKVCQHLLERRRRPRESRSPVTPLAGTGTPAVSALGSGSSPTSVDRTATATTVNRALIPGYSISQILGESDKAVVYLAASSQLGRNVALKVSAEAREPADDAGRQQFAREYAAVVAINHPTVVDLYDHGVQDGREFIAMEYFPCGDLKARLQHPISEAEALDFVRRIAAALCVVHAAGLVHRDLKPPNVMLRETGEVVLIDFGLARGIDEGRGSTRTGMLRGSPYYMSPEQAQGQPLDGRTDLYSLGIMFYEMLTGRKPYVGSTAIEVLQQHVAAPTPTLPPPLARHQWLLERLIAKSRDDRFATAQAALDAIAAVPGLEMTDAIAAVAL